MQSKNKGIVLLIVLAVIFSVQGALLAQESEFDSTAFLFGPSTGTQAAVFAVFLARQGALDSALSISNVLAAPASVQEVLDERFSDLEGTLEFYLWDYDGELYFYETGPDSPGSGLSEAGTLTPGQTYRVLLSDILNEIEAFDREAFAGYGWIIANFDGVQGTATVTDFGSYNNAYAFQPDVGSSFYELNANAGVPLNPPDLP